MSWGSTNTAHRKRRRLPLTVLIQTLIVRRGLDTLLNSKVASIAPLP
jgi:hypothetical protein